MDVNCYIEKKTIMTIVLILSLLFYEDGFKNNYLLFLTSQKTKTSESLKQSVVDAIITNTDGKSIHLASVMVGQL